MLLKITLLVLLLESFILWLFMRQERVLRPERKGRREDSFAGFLYDEAQGIFYSAIDCWQRIFGYRALYDEAALMASMVIHCEPIRFEYGGKNWLIELWKGQYGMAAGCEIGVYTCPAGKPEQDGGYIYTDTFPEDHLCMRCTLVKNGRTLFVRSARHWWLTGFILGGVASPKSLKMNVRIRLKNIGMRNAFVAAMERAGYTRQELQLIENDVRFVFDKPRTKQPKNQRGPLARLTLWKNFLLCALFNRLTVSEDLSPDKVALIMRRVPSLYGVMRSFTGDGEKACKRYGEGRRTP